MILVIVYFRVLNLLWPNGRLKKRYESITFNT